MHTQEKEIGTRHSDPTLIGFYFSAAHKAERGQISFAKWDKNLRVGGDGALTEGSSGSGDRCGGDSIGWIDASRACVTRHFGSRSRDQRGCRLGLSGARAKRPNPLDPLTNGAFAKRITGSGSRGRFDQVFEATAFRQRQLHKGSRNGHRSSRQPLGRSVPGSTTGLRCSPQFPGSRGRRKGSPFPRPHGCA